MRPGGRIGTSRSGYARAFFGRLSSLIKISVLAVPAALFLYGSFADCSGRPAAGWLGLVGAGACARNEMLGNVLLDPGQPRAS